MAFVLLLDLSAPPSNRNFGARSDQETAMTRDDLKSKIDDAAAAAKSAVDDVADKAQSTTKKVGSKVEETGRKIKEAAE